jgi:hypothetical protein
MLNINAQTTTDSTENKLIGTWYLYYKNPKNSDTLELFKTSKTYMSFGSRIEINNDHSFKDIYTAPCGNDENIHDSLGYWSFDSYDKTFETSIPIDFNYKKFSVLFIDSNKLILTRKQ